MQDLCLLESLGVPFCSPSHGACSVWGLGSLPGIYTLGWGPVQVQKNQPPQSWAVSHRQLYQVSPCPVHLPPRGIPPPRKQERNSPA